MQVNFVMASFRRDSSAYLVPVHPSPRILLSPLDWGLGHTTRIIPVGKSLQRQGATLILAGTKKQLGVLAESFPRAECHEIPAYGVTYAKRLPAMWAVFAQVPRLLKVIRAEHEWLLAHQSSLRLSGIVSDNRYGLWHPELPSIMICHQLAPPLGGVMSPMRNLLWRAHRARLQHFDQVWIPDLVGESSLAGDMVPRDLPKNYHHIGWISRLEGVDPAPPTGALRHVQAPARLILLSGPEPQRSLLEQALLRQLSGLDGDSWLVQGLAGSEAPIQEVPGGLLIPYFSEKELKYWLPQAGIVIARAGYSSIMDFAHLNLPHVALIPTPGQPEQEYLGRRLRDRGAVALLSAQDPDLSGLTGIDLKGISSLEDADAMLEQVVGDWMRQLLQR